MRFIAIWLLLTSVSKGSFAAENVKDVAELFMAATNNRHQQYQSLFKQVFIEEKICLSAEYNCVLEELNQLKIKSHADFYSAMNMLTSLYQKKITRDADCQEICRINLNAKFLDAAFSLIETIKLDEMLIYNEFKGSDLTRNLIRAGEDLAIFKYLLRVTDKMHQLNARIIIEKVFDPALAIKAKQFPAKIALLERAELLKSSYLAGLKADSREYNAFLKTAGDDEKSQSAQREAVERFHKAVR